MISDDPAVSRELSKYELMQIWIFDPKIKPLDGEQAKRMKEQFGTNAIPLHVILDTNGDELARFDYTGTSTPKDYMEFLKRGMAKFEKREANR